MQYGISPYTRVNPSWSYQNPLWFPSGQQAQPLQPRFGPASTYPGGTPAGFGEGFGQSGFGASGIGQPEYGALAGQGGPHLSPELFAGGLGRQHSWNLGLSPADATFITEIARCGRGLQEIAEQLENNDQNTQRRGFYAATAHLFYAFGLLSSKGIFIPGELPVGRQRTESIGASNACREFGKQLDRFVDKYATGRGVVEELNHLVERGRTCYLEISKGVEGENWATDQQTRKKVA